MAWILGTLVFAAAAILVARRARQEPQPPLNVRLFAEHVAAGRLPLSLSIETLGGVSTMLIPRGTALPTVRRETFSTAADNQASIEVHVLVGDRTLAADNVTVGTFSIIALPAGLRGVPKLEVSFSVDDQGVFRFSARDLGTGRSQPVSIAGSLSTPLPQTRIASMLDAAKAEEAKGEYGIARTTPDDVDSLTVYTKELRELVQRTRTSLDSGHGVPEAARKVCEGEIRRAERLLEANALPERASAKLNTLKADELEGVLKSLGEAARSCQ